MVIGHIAGKQSFHLVLPLARWESSEQAHSVYRSELEHGVKRARGRPRGKEGTDLEKPRTSWRSEQSTQLWERI